MEKHLRSSYNNAHAETQRHKKSRTFFGDNATSDEVNCNLLNARIESH